MGRAVEEGTGAGTTVMPIRSRGTFLPLSSPPFTAPAAFRKGKSAVPPEPEEAVT